MTPTREEMRRALEARHGAELQARFDAGRVAVCGLGGLGSNAAIALARAGVGHLHLIDFDRVDLSNLNRQQYTAGQLGQYKTDALRDTLGQIAPYCAVRTDTLRVTEENLADLLGGVNILTPLSPHNFLPASMKGSYTGNQRLSQQICLWNLSPTSILRGRFPGSQAIMHC